MDLRRTATLTALLVGATLLVAMPPAAAAGWVPPGDVSDPAEVGDGPQVAVGPDGTATVVWRDFNGGRRDLLVATRAPGAATYGAPQVLSYMAYSLDARVLTDATGTTTVVWRQGLFDGEVLSVAVRPAGSPTFGETQIFPGVFGSSVPAVAADAEGNTTVVWHDLDGNGFSAVRAAGQPAFDEAEPLDTDEDVVGPLSLSVDPGGAAVVAWAAEAGIESNDIVTVSRPSATADFGSAVVVTAGAPAAEHVYPDVLLVGDDVTVAWAAAGTGTTIDLATGPLGGVYSEAAPMSAPGISGAPSLAWDGARTTLAWTSRSQGEPDFRARARVRPAGATDFGPEAVLSPTGTRASSPVVAGAGGSTTVAWDTGPVPSRVQSATLAAGTPAFAPTVTIEGPSPDEVRTMTDVAVTSGGEATVVWSAVAGEHAVVRSSTFDQTPPSVQGLSVPARVRVGVAVPFAVTATDRWPGLVTTWSFGDGKGTTGPSPTHTFSRGGAYAVQVKATDAAGNTTTRIAPIVVAELPRLLVTRLVRKQFRAKTRLRAIASEAGTVTMRVQRCRSTGKSCSRWADKGVRAKAIGLAPASYRFPARLDGHRLEPGRYRVVVRLVAADGATSLRRIRPFTVLPRR